jgi:multisubunit Na+/H+ antiporter MnhG subunit
MEKTVEKDSVMKKSIHYGTIIVIFLLIIPASTSANSFYLPLVFLLVGVNLFNDLYSRCKGNTKLVFLSSLVSAVPLIAYVILKKF